MSIIKNILIIGINMLGIGDWGLGIGPNPQSPIPIIMLKKILLISFIISIKLTIYE